MSAGSTGSTLTRGTLAAIVRTRAWSCANVSALAWAKSPMTPLCAKIRHKASASSLARAGGARSCVAGPSSARRNHRAVRPEAHGVGLLDEQQSLAAAVNRQFEA